MVGVYEPYVEVCKRLAELSPCGGGEQKLDPRQLRRGGDRERRQDRPRGDRPAGGGRVRQRVPRSHAADDDDDGEGQAVQEGLRAVRARGLPRARPVPVPRRLERRRARRRSRISSRRTSTRRRSPASCSSRCRARAASSPCRRTSRRRLQELLPRARDPLRRRRGAVGRRPHRADVGDRALRRRRAGPRSSRASRSAAACRWPASPAAAELMDAVPPGGLGGTFGGNPLACAAALAVLDAVREPEFRAQARRARRAAALARSTRWRATCRTIGEVRGLGPMLAVRARRDRERAAGRRARRRSSRRRSSAACSSSACGMYGNVIRLLAPLTISDEELEEGSILEGALVDASAGSPAA